MALKESGPIEQPKTTETISEELLNQTFTDGEFLFNLQEMYEHLVANYSESGFAVLNIDGKIALTDLFKSPKIGSVENAEGSFSNKIEIPEDYMPNVFIVVHSHPKELAPSTKDLDVWDKLKLNKPEIIEAVMARSGRKTHLFVYQKDKSKPQSNHYQTWFDGNGIEKLKRLMEESGIRFETLELDTTFFTFNKKELAKLKTFA